MLRRVQRCSAGDKEAMRPRVAHAVAGKPGM